MLPSNQKQTIEQAKFTYSPIGKPFEKQTKTIKDQEKKQVDTLKSLEFFDKQLPSIKVYIKRKAISELRRIGEEEKLLIKVRWFTKVAIKLMILENLKQYKLSVIVLELILLICIQQTINKAIWQSILKVRQDQNMILT